jgi:hypothetical protein
MRYARIRPTKNRPCLSTRGPASVYRFVARERVVIVAPHGRGSKVVGKPMNAYDGLGQLQVNYQSHLTLVRDQLVKDARALLAAALADPNRLSRGTSLDAYMYPANALALAAASSGMLSTAAEVYQALIADIKEHIATTGEQLPLLLGSYW